MLHTRQGEFEPPVDLLLIENVANLRSLTPAFEELLRALRAANYKDGSMRKQRVLNNMCVYCVHGPSQL